MSFNFFFIEVEIYCFTSHRSFIRPIYCFVSVRSLLFCRRSNTRLFYVCAFSLSILKAVKHKTLTQCRAIVGPPPTTLSQHQPSIGLPCVVFDTALNVGLRHRRRANINPALVQSIVTLPPTCRYLLYVCDL